jgi:hypothetical protein
MFLGCVACEPRNSLLLAIQSLGQYYANVQIDLGIFHEILILNLSSASSKRKCCF